MADKDGTYIILSSLGSTSDLALRNHKATLLNEASDYSNAEQFKVDFHNRKRIAGCVRAHPALIFGVRQKIDHPIQKNGNPTC
ncbi:hypothetical protein NST74_06990 [Paenibacillus sp. FSL F4-0125]|uniref:hypothetical protein n=1 Tax=Paenibacillus sp. FSL F4-0125 TaxID=2954730 RepID=UPI0030F8248E